MSKDKLEYRRSKILRFYSFVFFVLSVLFMVNSLYLESGVERFVFIGLGVLFLYAGFYFYEAKSFKLSKQFLIVVFGIFMFLLTIASATSVSASSSQDLFCDYLDENISVSDCNSIWDEITNDSVVYEVNNITRNVTYNVTRNLTFNESVDLSDYYTRGEVDDLLNDSVDLESLKLEREYDLKKLEMQLKYGASNKSEDDDDDGVDEDEFSRLKREHEAQLEFDLWKQQKCMIYPNAEMCKDSLASEDDNPGNSSGVDDEVLTKILSRLENLENNQDSNVPRQSDSSNGVSPLLVGVICLVIGVLGFYVYNKEKTERVSKSLGSSSNETQLKLDPLVERYMQKQKSQEEANKPNQSDNRDASKRSGF